MSTFWGIGTTYYGKADKREHPKYGMTYITTEWFTVFYLPIVPIRSMRIGAVSTKSLILIVYSSTTSSFLILERLPIQWRQVLRTFVLRWGIPPLILFVIILVLALKK
jgi:hypothetical protein